MEATGAAVSVTLAPGILNNIFDGIERPLEKIADSGGAFITRGVSVEFPGYAEIMGYPHYREARRGSTWRYSNRGGSGDACDPA